LRRGLLQSSSIQGQYYWLNLTLSKNEGGRLE
jgi:hypothetical protein